MSLYAIRGTIRFDNEAFVLYATEASDEKLRIGAIASRCLTLLLQANGEVVSKRDLMSGAWGAFGLEVTENSLAQVVRQLRVALDKLQPGSDLHGNELLGNELIVTVPRIGYRLGERAVLLDADQHPDPPILPALAPPNEAAPATAQPEQWPNWLLLTAATLVCWGLLFKLPGLLFPAHLAEQPFAQAHVLQIDGVFLHREAMPDTALRPDDQQLAARARKLGQALALGDLHVYRFAGQERSINLLCSGELRPQASHCLGLQVDE